MKPETKKLLIQEIKILGIFALIFYIFFQIHYYKENPFIILRMVVAHFYLFIIPGYCLLLAAHKSLKKIERLIISIGVGYAVPTFLAYFLNVITKVNMMSYNKIISLVLIIIGILFFYMKLKKK